MKAPLQFSFFCSPFSRYPKSWHIVRVDRENGVKVYDDTTQKFTGLHSLSANDLKAILAKATDLRVAEGYERLGAKIGLTHVPSDDEQAWRPAKMAQ